MEEIRKVIISHLYYAQAAIDLGFESKAKMHIKFASYLVKINEDIDTRIDHNREWDDFCERNK
jgi:hypothetical protein